MNSPDRRVAELLKTLAMIYGIISGLGSFVIAVVVAGDSYYFGQTFFAIFVPCVLMVVLTTALLFAAGVLIDNLVLIREKIVGTDEEIGRTKQANTASKPVYTVNDEVKRQESKETVSNVKSQAEKTLEIFKALK